MKVFLGADHRGFTLKEKIRTWLDKAGYDVVDVGAKTYDPNDDYPLISAMVGRGVVENLESLGVLLCGSGVGASAAVNKINGVRGAIGVSQDQVVAGRNDDDMNVLVIPADEMEFERAKELIEAFLTTPHGREERYQRRINEIKKMEESN